ncbi:hypothetical protein [Nocardia aurantia]|uniref:Uncharacterized protein n=1 Tax=Nocardia aurantia TaxID=2585199 RepID=A0A7K0DM44_9NOCA|nr:hypothetical protein [Nocardia aurantia]MQY26727.1 hypothetical protein [Nocardia aurantia]
MIKTLVAAGILGAAVATAGVGVASARPVVVHSDYIGNYATPEACAADGASPKTGGSQYQCTQAQDGTWDLVTS